MKGDPWEMWGGGKWEMRGIGNLIPHGSSAKFFFFAIDVAQQFVHQF